MRGRRGNGCWRRPPASLPKGVLGGPPTRKSGESRDQYGGGELPLWQQGEPVRRGVEALVRGIGQGPPAGRRGPPQAPARERLRGRILAFCSVWPTRTTTRSRSCTGKWRIRRGFSRKSSGRPSSRCDRTPRSIVQELLGEAPVNARSFCEMSLMGQCFGPMLHLRRAKMAPATPAPPGPPFEFDVEELADHITRVQPGGDSCDSRRPARSEKPAGKPRRRPDALR